MAKVDDALLAKLKKIVAAYPKGDGDPFESALGETELAAFKGLSPSDSVKEHLALFKAMPDSLLKTALGKLIVEKTKANINAMLQKAEGAVGEAVKHDLFEDVDVKLVHKSEKIPVSPEMLEASGLSPGIHEITLTPETQAEIAAMLKNTHEHMEEEHPEEFQDLLVDVPPEQKKYVAAMLKNTHKHMQEHPEGLESSLSPSQPLNGYVTQDGKVYGVSPMWDMLKKWKEDVAKYKAEHEALPAGHLADMPDKIVTLADVWKAERAIAREIYQPLQFEPNDDAFAEIVLSMALSAVEYWIIPRVVVSVTVYKPGAALQIKHLVERMMTDPTFYHYSMTVDSYEELVETFGVPTVPHIVASPYHAPYPPAFEPPSCENIEVNFVLDTCGSHEIGLTKKGRETLHRFGAVAKDEA